MEVSQVFLDSLDCLGAWGILTTDANLRITGWNRWLVRHSGKQSHELVGLSLLEAYPDLGVRSLDRYFREALQGHACILSQRFHNYLLPMPPTISTPHVMHMQQTVRISPSYENGEISGTLTLIEDVTERVVTEFELRQQAERLEQANRHKDDFLAMLAHELRNPLAPIRNGVRILDLMAHDDAEARETCKMIERQVAHMTRLVDDLLDVSRIIRGKVRLQKAPCDLTAVARQVAQDYDGILADNSVHLSLDVPEQPCWIAADCVRLTQIVSNLLHNASKFTNPNGEVTLHAGVNRSEKELEIRVSDTGVGMSAETLANVFESFSQADSSLDRSKGGLGLGLALVKGLAELHEGTVTAHSEGLGRGSTFTVRLPLQEASPQQAPEHPREFEAAGNRRLLLIEDNHDAAKSMARLLRHLGYEVDLAFTGPEGVETARRTSPDVVICDIGLPGLDGFSVARLLRSDPITCDVYLIAQSGYGQSDDIRKALDAGFDLHLIKPVDFSRLEQALNADRRNLRMPLDA